MSIQTVFNSRFSVRLSILLSKVLPPKLGHGFGSLISSLLAVCKRTDLVQHISANQWVLLQESGDTQRLHQRVRLILQHAGRCYYDLYHNYHDPDRVREMVPFSDEMAAFLDHCRQVGGTLVVSPHLSNFDLVVQRLILGGLRAKVLSYGNPVEGYRLQNRIRQEMGMDLLPLKDRALMGEVIDFLKDGGVAATAIDRPLTDRKRSHWVSFFGRPSPLPIGHITMAMAADVPITVVSAIMRPDGKYGFLYSGPIHLKTYQNKKESILRNAEQILEVIADMIRKAPDQWLMYYPVWPDVLEEKPW